MSFRASRERVPRRDSTKFSVSFHEFYRDFQREIWQNSAWFYSVPGLTLLDENRSKPQMSNESIMLQAMKELFRRTSEFLSFYSFISTDFIVWVPFKGGPFLRYPRNIPEPTPSNHLKVDLQLKHLILYHFESPPWSKKYGIFTCWIDACRQIFGRNMENSDSMHKKLIQNILAS